MSTSDLQVGTLSNHHPDAGLVRDHIVFDNTEWVPDPHPELQLRSVSLLGDLKRYERCGQCGVEVLKKSDVPNSCDGDLAMDRAVLSESLGLSRETSRASGSADRTDTVLLTDAGRQPSGINA